MDNKAELQSNNVDLQSILGKVNGLPDKIVLPTLTNPAGAEHILSGYEAIDTDGSIIIGSASAGQSVTVIDCTANTTAKTFELGFTPKSGQKVSIYGSLYVSTGTIFASFHGNQYMVSTKTAPTEFSFVDGSSISYGYVTISLSGNTVTVVNSDSYYTTTLNLIMTIMNPRFYISGFETDGTQISASCEFEDGMTWAEFCESDYNTIGVVNNNGTIYLRNNIVQSGSTSVNVLATDTIVENTSYYSGI